MSDAKTLGEALPAEMARVRDEVMPAYLEIGDAGRFCVALMRHDLDLAATALASGDVVAMIHALKELREYEL
jgi:molybdopterin converting factor small subunit